MKRIASVLLLSGVVLFGSPVAILDWFDGDDEEVYVECALALPPNKQAIVHEFERFSWRFPGYEYYLDIDNRPPDRKQGWYRTPFFWKSYRVYARRAA